MSVSAKKAGKAPAQPARAKPAPANLTPTESTAPKQGEKPEPADLTFGIELEYVLIYLKNHPDRWMFGHDIIPEAWAVRLVEHAFDEDLIAKCKACHTTVRFPLDIECDLGGIGLPYKVDYGRWHVKQETVKMATAEKEAIEVPPEEYGIQGIEITSRILSAGSDLVVRTIGADHDHLIGFEEEIRAVVDRLEERFCSFGGTRARWDYLYPNRSCGFHVHVGQGTAGFANETVRKILMMNIACERLIDHMHSVDRITGTDYGIRPVDSQRTFDLVQPLIDTNMSQYPLSVGFQANGYKRRQQGQKVKPGPGIWSETRYPASKFRAVPPLRVLSLRSDIDAWMRLVDHAETNGELFSLYHSRPRYSVINIDNVGSAVKNTIEFRQCAATMDSKIILSWLDFAVKQVQYCRDTSNDKMKEILHARNFLRKPDTDYSALLETIGCNEDTHQHYLQRDLGRFQKTLRHEQAKLAQSAPKDLLAALALLNIREERNRLHGPNVQQRITEKLLFGGYGQFPRPWLDVFAPNSMEIVKQKITLGYIPPVDPLEAFVPASFSTEADRGSLSGSERGVFPSLPDAETESPLPYMHATLRPDLRGQATTYAGSSNPDISPMSRLPSPLMGQELPFRPVESRGRSTLGPQQWTSFKERYAHSRSESRRRSVEAAATKRPLSPEWGSSQTPSSPGEALHLDELD